VIEKKDDSEDKANNPKSSKKGFDMREHLTLRVDALEFERYQKKNAEGKNKISDGKSAVLPVGLQKLRKKVREAYDDDEDEDDYTYTFQAMPTAENEEENRLFLGLTDDEKRQLQQKEVIDIVKSQQNAGKMEALHMAHNLAKEAGLNGLSEKTVAIGMQEAVFEPEKVQKKAVKKEVSAKLKIKGDIKEGKIIQAARGIKKVENLGGQKAAKNLDMRDIIKAGEEKLDEIKLAELILKKSGQDVTKRKNKLEQSKEKIELQHFKEQNKEEKRTRTDFRQDDNFSR